jgi:hypothetical protein
MTRHPWDDLFDEADRIHAAALSHAHGSDAREILTARANLLRARGRRMRGADSPNRFGAAG